MIDVYETIYGYSIYFYSYSGVKYEHSENEDMYLYK